MYTNEELIFKLEEKIIIKEKHDFQLSKIPRKFVSEPQDMENLFCMIWKKIKSKQNYKLDHKNQSEQ